MQSPPEPPPVRSHRSGPGARRRRRSVPSAAGVAAAADVAVQAAVGAFVRRARRRGDAGDVPGWVLVTLMTAGLVTALWVLARDRLVDVFNRAITSVTGTSTSG